MKKYIVKCFYDEVDDKYVAVCPQFFGFIAYFENLSLLKKNCVKLLKVYSGNEDITGNKIQYVEQQTLEMGI